MSLHSPDILTSSHLVAWQCMVQAGSLFKHSSLSRYRPCCVDGTTACIISWSASTSNATASFELHACRAVDFLIMEGQNLSAIAPDFVPFEGALGAPRQAWVLIAAVIMLPTVYLRNLGLLAYLSAAGVLTSVSLTCLVGSLAGKHGEQRWISSPS